ncbi:MAG: PorP/SprF family type IX secretion system membrane protein [Chitinophagales bacterium]|jgi:type IX secretion system PorP/SprF family membrane protein|nr:PorP/SprF family type IX secretion system membrane protein [Chitinophagales bacterium]
MKKLFLIPLFLFGSVLNILAQQDMAFSMYMFNPTFVNPAAAGYQNRTVLSGLFRYQWAGIEGAPRSGYASIQGPFGSRNNMAYSAAFKLDNIGNFNNFGIDLSYAYRLRINEDEHLSLGLMGSLFFLNHNRTNARVTDPDFTTAENVNKVLPNFGAGIFFNTKRFFVGASVPHLLRLKIGNSNADSVTVDNLFARQYNHYMATIGGVIGPEEGLKFKPTAFFKWSQNSSPNLDLNLNFLLLERFWIGAGYRFGGEVIDINGSDVQFVNISQGRGESIIGILKVLVTEKLEIGYAYDYTLSNLRVANSGSHELFVGWDLGRGAGKDKFVSPRYLNYF